MAKKSKKEIIEELKARGYVVTENESYSHLCSLLKNSRDLEIAPTEITPASGTIIFIENKTPKRNMYFADHYRDELDMKVLNKELIKREHKGKIKKVITVKHYDVDEEGKWKTEFTIELKE